MTWGSKQPNLVANKPEHFFGNTEHEKCSLVTKTKEKVVLRKKILRQRNLAKIK